MKKLLQSLFILLFVATTAMAQERTITGTVTSAEDGLPIPGASVRLKDIPGSGAVTDAQGKFSLRGPSKAKTLVISSIAFLKKEVEITGNVVNVALSPDAKVLNEVVIEGAYGTKTTSRAASANIQNVTGEKLNTVRSTNLNNALAGKVAGVQVRSQSAAALGRNTTIRLRGASGFGTGNDVLYVVDGTILPNADDVNLDDIDDISVLQGPAAAALLGSQAAAGAILITTKKGKPAVGSGIAVNIGTTFENAYVLPNYQNVYAGGNQKDLIQYNWKAGDPLEWKALDGKYYHNYSDDSSWGPKMVGQEYIPWYAWYPGTQYSYKTTNLVAQPDNARDYFDTGVTYNNSISYSNANEKYNVKVSYGNQYTHGLIPNTNLKKNTLNFVANYNINDHFSVGANINYVNTLLNGEIDDAYSSQSTGSFNQWFHRDLDMKIMKELRGLTVPGIGSQKIYASWNHNDPNTYNAADPRSFYAANYWYNFYTYYDLLDKVNQRDRFYGNISFTYKVNNDLKFTGTYRKQQNTTFYESKYSTRLNDSGTQTSGNNALVKGYYGTGNTYSNRENYEILGYYTKKINDFSIDATAGMDIFRSQYKTNTAATNNGLSIPDLFTIGNSVDQPVIGNDRSQDKYRALLARATFGYKNMVFLEGSIRNDWYSTLPEKNSSVLSKSIGASFVFSDLLKDNTAFNWLYEGKIRASYGEIPQSISAYTYPGSAYGVDPLKWNGNLLMNTPDQLVDPDIKGATSSNSEYGIDLKFLKGRLGVSATYWDAREINYPRAITINAASGFSSIVTNIGRIDRKGLDFSLNAKPFRSTNFSWDINASYANLLDNKVVEISKKYQQTRISVQAVWGTTMPYMIHQEGMQWGQIYGNGIKRNADGVPLLTSTGAYINDPNVYFGSVLPKHTGGLQNSFVVMKDFEINANIDWQIGGKFVSLSNMWGTYSGLTARTAALNDKGVSVRDAVADGGGVRVDGVDATTGQPKTYYVDAQTYYQNLYNNKTFDDYVYDLTFVKLREVSVGYRLPLKKWGADKFVRSATFSVVARNPVLIYAKTKDFDPSEISATTGETAQLPGTRGIGFNLRVGF
ncbi:SusC/RagA family TonB-linked outer membrane protein [Pedobacter montanisoli]|uniref:SusC/RagA family TonB-linked outer membrane protein n=1 Tax=Pedobacter montanisoli TaxID=2923277 RepID=A0ABS9ZU01_9SPHI|nr:SusC/RagA family TonB-linked outer membrane protein [Pedobacter montanisoli]MCJ0741837.1 SusC/RagA family TonB-linked outer membrane protein [Pedobacter montanisoli]